MYHSFDDRGQYLGFSLKPPKWLRKLQPGKILAKIALPAAAVAATLLIPGVGGVLVKGASVLIGGAVAGGKAAGSAIQSVVSKAITAGGDSSTSDMSFPSIVVPPSMLPGATTPPSLSLPPPPGAAVAQPQAEPLPPYVLPALIVVGAALLARRRN